MMPKIQKYPNSLRKHRKAAGLRQHEVARALKLTTCERISKWENGHSVPALCSLFRLAMLYHVSLQDLYDKMYQIIQAEFACPEPDFPATQSPQRYMDDHQERHTTPPLLVQQVSAPLMASNGVLPLRRFLGRELSSRSTKLISSSLIISKSVFFGK